MAANLSGMFTQLNNAINANPMGKQQNNSVAGMTQRPQDSMNPFIQGMGQGITGLMGGDKSQMATSQQAKLAAEQQMAQLDLETPQGLQKAAQLYQGLGMMPEAMQMMQAADSKVKAENAKNNAILDAGNQTIQEETAKKKRKQQKSYALAVAKRKGDKDAVTAIQSDSMEPSAYLESQAAGGKNVSLADGAMLVGPDGTILAENTKDFKPSGGGAGGVWGDDLSATMQKRLNASGDSYREAESLSREYGTMLEQLSSRDLGAGWTQTAETFANSATGRRDDDDYFRTQAIKLKNSEAIGSLPPGPASDKDISIVMRGFPADNAGPEEIKQFLEASKRVADDVAQYEKFKSDYITDHGDERGFLSAWSKKADQLAQVRYKEATPVGAIEKVLANPALRDKFLAKYKWLPPLQEAAQ